MYTIIKVDFWLSYKQEAASCCQWANIQWATSSIWSSPGISTWPTIDIDTIPLSPDTKLVIYADDVLLYKPIGSSLNYDLLQKVIDALGHWSMTNYVKFNPRQNVKLWYFRGKGLLQLPVTVSHWMGNPWTLWIQFNISGSQYHQICRGQNTLASLLPRPGAWWAFCFSSFIVIPTHICCEIFTMVQPHLEYACEVWDPHLDKNMKLLEKAQKFASKVCFSLPS